MQRWAWTAAIASASLAAGCAAAPQSEQLRPAGETVQEGGAGHDAAIAPNLVVDAQDTRQGGMVTCRDVLNAGSNVIVTRCMTADDWNRWKRRETLRAQAVVRALQGSHYSSPVW